MPVTGEAPRLPFISKVVDVPSINQATKYAWIPRIMHVDTVVDMPVVMHQQVPQVQTVPVTGEAPRLPFIGKVVDVPSINQATKYAWIPRIMHVDTVVDMPVVMHQQVPQVQTVPVTGGSPAVAVHRQSCGRAVDQPGDQVRLDSTECLRRHSCRHACCDVPTGPLQISFQEEIIEVVKPFPVERISERTVEQIVDTPGPQIQEKLWMMLKAFRKRALLSTLLNKSPVYQCLSSRTKSWKSRRSLRGGASRSVLSDRLTMCQCLRSTSRLWKSS